MAQSVREMLIYSANTLRQGSPEFIEGLMLRQAQHERNIINII
jgi:hypothetical protein